MILEIFGTIFGFIYLYLEIKQKQGMWIIGFLMALIYAIIYFQQEVYASMGFQIYYILVSIYGFILWGKDKLQGKYTPPGKDCLQGDGNFLGKDDLQGDGKLQKITAQKTEKQTGIFYRKLPLKTLLVSTAVYIAATTLMVTVLNKITADPMPFTDSSITVLSAIATYWLSKSYKEQWIVWLVVNLVTTVMTFRLGLYPTAILYTVNALASVYGYIHWIRSGKLII